jgi:hypothetical protein
MRNMSWEPTLTTLFVGLLVSGFTVIAQVAESNADGIGSIVSNLGVVGTLVWYLYHNTTKTLPGLAEAHNQVTKEMLENHNLAQDKIAAAFALNLEKERKLREDELDAPAMISEKTFFAMRNFHPFLIMGEPNSLHRLRDHGYQTFSRWIDESYDLILDPAERAGPQP